MRTSPLPLRGDHGTEDFRVPAIELSCILDHGTEDFWVPAIELSFPLGLAGGSHVAIGPTKERVKKGEIV